MFTKTKITLALALVLGAAPAALANEPTGNDGGGYRVQNWAAIWAHQNTDAYHAFGSATPGKKHGAVVVAPAPTRRLSRESD
jgi:hypothetical protein